MAKAPKSCGKWVSDNDPARPTSERCKRPVGHPGHCAGWTVGYVEAGEPTDLARPPIDQQITDSDLRQVAHRVDEARKQVHKELISTAIQNVQYVAMGSVMKRSLAQRYNLSEEQAERLLLSICTDLCDKIARL